MKIQIMFHWSLRSWKVIDGMKESKIGSCGGREQKWLVDWSWWERREGKSIIFWCYWTVISVIIAVIILSLYTIPMFLQGHSTFFHILYASFPYLSPVRGFWFFRAATLLPLLEFLHIGMNHWRGWFLKSKALPDFFFPSLSYWVLWSRSLKWPKSALLCPEMWSCFLPCCLLWGS